MDSHLKKSYNNIMCNYHPFNITYIPLSETFLNGGCTSTGRDDELDGMLDGCMMSLTECSVVV